MRPVGIRQKIMECWYLTAIAMLYRLLDIKPVIM